MDKMLLSLGLLLGATTLATIAYLRYLLFVTLWKGFYSVPQEKLWSAGEVWSAGAITKKLLLRHQTLETQ